MFRDFSFNISLMCWYLLFSNFNMCFLKKAHTARPTKEKYIKVIMISHVSLEFKE
jgi:hypothetical protein